MGVVNNVLLALEVLHVLDHVQSEVSLLNIGFVVVVVAVLQNFEVHGFWLWDNRPDRIARVSGFLLSNCPFNILRGLACHQHVLNLTDTLKLKLHIHPAQSTNLIDIQTKSIQYQQTNEHQGALNNFQRNRHLPKKFTK
jgi:hypothetical protein